MAEGAVVANEVVRIAIAARGITPVAADYTEFGGDTRQGLISFDPVVTEVTEPRPGLALDMENQRADRADGVIPGEFQDNSVTGALFYGDKRGMILWYEQMREGKGAGLPVEKSRGMIESLEQAPDGSGFLNWSVNALMQVDPTETAQP